MHIEDVQQIPSEIENYILVNVSPLPIELRVGMRVRELLYYGLPLVSLITKLLK
jgi:hypothetical protein